MHRSSETGDPWTGQIQRPTNSQTFRPPHNTGSAVADPRISQQSWPGQAVLLRPYTPWPPQASVPPLLNTPNSQQNGEAGAEVAAADVNPVIDSCDENMVPKINMLFDENDQDDGVDLVERSTDDFPHKQNLINENATGYTPEVDNIVSGGMHSHANFINGSADGSLTFPFTLGAGALDFR
ncbi:hypothetical protein PR202_ga29547 [Eleusine coracana subsp. coracana]|uniref:Uncharacterized protein n=1 Tax=Eleusine coracana subsp. coracana TaxID=191504 RepID=A0AAV5DME3_ELECO|nr:hypothetical protein PR202_ga29547 [Eleusine coracana subsp. coracana]